MRSSELGERGLIGILIAVPGERSATECLHEVSRGCNTKAASRPVTPRAFKRNETLQEPLASPLLPCPSAVLESPKYSFEYTDTSDTLEHEGSRSLARR